MTVSNLLWFRTERGSKFNATGIDSLSDNTHTGDYSYVNVQIVDEETDNTKTCTILHIDSAQESTCQFEIT